MLIISTLFAPVGMNNSAIFAKLSFYVEILSVLNMIRQLKFVYGSALVCLLLMLGSGQVAAQSAQFASNSLKLLAEGLKVNYGVECKRSEVIRLGMNQVVVESDRFGEVYHIGFRLFARDLMEHSPSPVYRFAERYLLQLYLTKSQDELDTKLKEDKVQLRYYSQQGTAREKLKQTLVVLQREIPFIITTDNSHYTLLWRQEGKSYFMLRFPIQYELLWGMNKIECENKLQQHIQDLKPQAVPETAELPDEATLEKQENGSLRSAGEWYEIEEVNSDTYYQRTEHGLKPVMGPAYPVESTHNLFTIMQGANLQVAVTQKRYGGQKTTFELPLSQLLAFTKAEGCETYVGIEEMDKKQVTGCLVWINRSMGYNHVGFFTLPLKALSSGSRDTLTLELFAYVPTHNLQNMYDERTPGKRTYHLNIITE